MKVRSEFSYELDGRAEGEPRKYFIHYEKGLQHVPSPLHFNRRNLLAFYTES